MAQHEAAMQQMGPIYGPHLRSGYATPAGAQGGINQVGDPPKPFLTMPCYLVPCPFVSWRVAHGRGKDLSQKSSLVGFLNGDEVRALRQMDECGFVTVVQFLRVLCVRLSLSPFLSLFRSHTEVSFITLAG